MAIGLKQSQDPNREVKLIPLADNRDGYFRDEIK